MVRDLDRYKQSKEDHDRWGRITFNNKKQYLLSESVKKRKRGIDEGKEKYIKQADSLVKMANKMKYQFHNDCYIHYGYCNSLNKDVSFLPNTCQLDTQECFKHRRD